MERGNISSSQPERQHLRPQEREELFRWMAALSIVKERELDPRFRQGKNGARDLGLLRATLDRLVEQLLDTVPLEELVSVRANAKALRCTVGVRPVRDSQLQEYGRFVSYEQLDVLIKACDDHCLMCSLEPHEVRSCALRKAIGAIGGYAPQCGLNV